MQETTPEEATTPNSPGRRALPSKSRRELRVRVDNAQAGSDRNDRSEPKPDSVVEFALGAGYTAAARAGYGCVDAADTHGC
jgi:hypothetical protein